MDGDLPFVSEKEWKMTRKHFKAISNALKAERPGEHWNANKRVQWDLCVKAIAEACAAQNEWFKREQFYEACGGLFNV